MECPFVFICVFWFVFVFLYKIARVAELVDAPDLGSGPAKAG